MSNGAEWCNYGQERNLGPIVPYVIQELIITVGINRYRIGSCTIRSALELKLPSISRHYIAIVILPKHRMYALCHSGYSYPEGNNKICGGHPRGLQLFISNISRTRTNTPRAMYQPRENPTYSLTAPE